MQKKSGPGWKNSDEKIFFRKKKFQNLLKRVKMQKKESSRMEEFGRKNFLFGEKRSQNLPFTPLVQASMAQNFPFTPLVEASMAQNLPFVLEKKSYNLLKRVKMQKRVVPGGRIRTKKFFLGKKRSQNLLKRVKMQKRVVPDGRIRTKTFFLGKKSLRIF